MEKFTTHTGRAVPLRRNNVDTDQIIPAEYLKRVSRAGFGDGLFRAWRDDPDFVLNDSRYDGATVLVAGRDFGTGSSREHAVWALQDHGFRAVISARFADIFRGNALNGGLLAVELAEDAVAAFQDLSTTDPATEITVDLVEREVRAPGLTVAFQLDDYTRWRLMEGLDDIGLTLTNADDITAYESGRAAWMPVVR
ncbi:MAG TPA: 3-isopropylmalate dehydratase small subunit [Mycobacteriales bacterium]|jgi:3-isopropylmalate/(R)-2-methylmalate dehydratase small subunit|nr:3-isopropylmalate dehydratase small subunit [Mycobacteriales bacterium]